MNDAAAVSKCLQPQLISTIKSPPSAFLKTFLDVAKAKLLQKLSFYIVQI